MAPTQLSLGDGSSLNRSNQCMGAPSGGAATSDGENFTLSVSETAKNVRTV
jgi:hypothetical protein